MNLFKKILFLAFIFLSLFHVTHAAKPPTIIDVSLDRKYVFIENKIDHEYFIAPTTLDPRFTGTNVWARVGKTNQTSLGYMGTNYIAPLGSYIDYWLDNSPIKNPYQGIRCWVITADCPATGFLPPEYMDEKGSYKSIVGYGEYGGYIRASFAQGAYEYFNRQQVGVTDTIDMNACYTTQEYNPKNGERCKDLDGDASWYIYKFKATKLGHITLEDTKAFNEIWVGSDGTPTISEGNEYCKYAVITANGLPDQKEGISCKMVKYNMKGDPSTYEPTLLFYMVLDTDALGFTPDMYDLQIQGGNGNWKPHSYQGNVLKDIFHGGNDYIEVLFSKAFFKKMLDSGRSTAGLGDIFTFMIANDIVVPQSGFYQFRTSMHVDILPREYSISIKPKHLNKTSAEGTIGEGQQDIDFEYKVTQSAPRTADIVTAQVLGENIQKNNQSYCLFKSDDGALTVPIPSYLSFKDESGGQIKEYNGCDSTHKIDMTKALWDAVPWDENQSGSFYSTDLKLSFPMSDPVSRLTLDGHDWDGTVHAEGDIKVEAKWIGVDR